MNEDWHKSSYSGYNGDCVQARFRKSSFCQNGECVEAGWHKSSYSANGNCAEVADGCGEVHVRDSKDPGGPVLTFTRAEWEEFTTGIRARA